MFKNKKNIFFVTLEIFLRSLFIAGGTFGLGLMFGINFGPTLFVSLAIACLLVIIFTIQALHGVRILYNQKFGIFIGCITFVTLWLIFNFLVGVTAGAVLTIIFSVRRLAEVITKQTENLKNIFSELRNSLF